MGFDWPETIMDDDGRAYLLVKRAPVVDLIAEDIAYVRGHIEVRHLVGALDTTIDPPHYVAMIVQHMRDQIQDWFRTHPGEEVL